MAFVLHVVGGLLFDRSARSLTKDTILGMLERQQTTLLEKYRVCPQTTTHHRIFTHVIGIERWGQTRLRTVLGGPLRATEKYDQYRPAQSTQFYELITLFEETRDETIAIARAIPVDEYHRRRIPHNQWGQLTVAGWFNYLLLHANQESQRVR